MAMPTCAAIAAHHGRPVACFACGYANNQDRLERAHAIPQAIGGPDTVDNLALLCGRCHREAPDTADAAFFWRWVGEHPERTEVGCALAKMTAMLPLIPPDYQARTTRDRPRTSSAVAPVGAQARPASHARRRVVGGHVGSLGHGDRRSCGGVILGQRRPRPGNAAEPDADLR